MGILDGVYEKILLPYPYLPHGDTIDIYDASKPASSLPGMLSIPSNQYVESIDAYRSSQWKDILHRLPGK